MADKFEDRINKITEQIAKLVSKIKELKAGMVADPSSDKFIKNYDRLIKMEADYLNLLRKRIELQRQAANIPGGHPNQAKYGQPPVEPKGGGPAAGGGLGKGAEKQRAEEAREQKAQEKIRREKEKRAQLESLRAKIANDAMYAELREQLKSRNLGVNDVYSAINRGGGITQVNASKNVGGINNKFQAYVNEKTGKSTPGLSSQFRTFGSDILRDIGQFTKWSIAVAAVYTPLQKLGELLTIMVDNEARLADATIAANVPLERSGEVFDAVATSANRAGESINTTIDAYAQAIRAAGRYTDEGEKNQKAVALLNDALLLSKISTLDQSQAIDTLTAALLQSGKELDDGEELLNKWVRVSQVANVGIDALATGVAVLGDSAEVAGLDIDHLNALIAVLSEQSISGSKEAANTAKALIGSYQSDKSEQVLNRYGVALRKANGEVRSFLEVYQDLARLRQAGIISDPGVSEIALAIGGGGVRRAKDASALINSQDRLNILARESAQVTGDSSLAQDSLAKKLDTVQTSMTKLSNAWQELAQTLGDDGGILDLFKTLLNVLTGVTKAADELFKLLGKSGPELAVFGTAFLALRGIPAANKQTILQGLGTNYGGGQFLPGGGRAPAGGATVPNSFWGGVGSDLLRMNTRGATMLGGAAVGLSAVGNLSEGKSNNAIANILGGVIGGAIGNTLGGPPGISAGAIIGSSAADAMTTAIFDYKPQWKDFFAETIRPTAIEDGAKPKTAQEQLIEDAPKASGLTNTSARLMATLLNIAPDKFLNALLTSKTGRARSPFVPDELRDKPFEYTGEKFTALQIQEIYANQAYKDRFKKLSDRETIQGGGVLQEEFAANEQNRKLLEELANKEKIAKLQKLAQGDITPATFGRQSQQLTGFPSVALQAMQSYGEEFKAISKDIDSTTEAYEAFLYIASNGTEEQIAQLSQYSTDIRTLNYLLANFEPADIGTKLTMSFGEVIIESPEQLKKLLSGLTTDAANVANRTLLNVKLSEFKLPQLIGDYNKPSSDKNVDASIKFGKKIQDDFYKSAGLFGDALDETVDRIEPFSTAVERGGHTVFRSISGLEERFYNLGEKAAEAAGELESIQGFGFQKYDIDQATFLKLQDQANALGKSWENQYPGFESKPEDFLAITKDGIVKAHADTKILALLLEKLVDQGQKQLDGQYNIPEGATFWIPLTAAYYRNKGGTGDSLSDALSSLDLGENTSATDANTTALNLLTDSLYFQSEKHGSQPGNSLTGPGSKYFQSEKFGADSKYHLAPGNPHTDLPEFPQEKPPYYRSGRFELESFPKFDFNAIGQSIKNFIDNFKAGIDYLNMNKSIGGSLKVGKGSIGGRPGDAPVSPTTKLDLKVSSNINLLVDGRVLASVMQNYLASELLKTEQSQGTITKKFMI
jgi:TP901 family phage tail tape measure protein